MLHSRGQAVQDTIVWTLNNHKFEFTRNEFGDLIRGMKENGLFAFLCAERPALKDQLLLLARMAAPDALDSEHEHVLEQCLLDLKDRIR